LLLICVGVVLLLLVGRYPDFYVTLFILIDFRKATFHAILDSIEDVSIGQLFWSGWRELIQVGRVYRPIQIYRLYPKIEDVHA
jgi:hypothetical protein